MCSRQTVSIRAAATGDLMAAAVDAGLQEVALHSGYFMTDWLWTGHRVSDDKAVWLMNQWIK